MDIYLTEMQGEPADPKGYQMRFQSLPEKIEVSTGASFHTFDIVNLGDTCLPHGEELVGVNWEAYFFGEARNGTSGDVIHTWQDPETAKNKLVSWQSSHQLLRLNITKTWVNYDVYVESLDWNYSGGYGDINYQISFKQARNPQIIVNSPKVMTSIPGQVVPDDTIFTCDTSTTVKVAPGGKYTAMVYCPAGRPNVVAGTGGVCDVSLTSRQDDNWYFTCTATGEIGQQVGIYINGNKKQFAIEVASDGYGAKNGSGSSSPNTYCVNPGDTIWSAALRVYHDGSKWKTFYDANQQLIEDTAKENGRESSEQGRYLYPGTRLIIP